MTREIHLPGEAVLRSISKYGNFPWEIEVSGSTGGSTHPLRFGYNNVNDALIDYMFRFQGGGQSDHCTPIPFRTSYSRTFWPMNALEFCVRFHQSLLEAIEAIQEAEDFCERNSEFFAMQGAGIHRLNESTRRFEIQYESQSLPELVEQVHRGSISGKEGYDIFISHASEDKAECVRPLAKELTMLGLKVWYDEFELKLGDSLRRSIDRGIATSRCGLVVLSPNFLQKNWPQYELDGMVARMVDGEARIIPLWFGIAKNEVMAFSPSLADRVSILFSLSDLTDISIRIAESL